MVDTGLREVQIVTDKPSEDVVSERSQSLQPFRRRIVVIRRQRVQQAAVIEVIGERVTSIAPIPRRIVRRVLRDVVVQRASGSGRHSGGSHLSVLKSVLIDEISDDTARNVERSVAASADLESVALNQIVRRSERNLRHVTRALHC